MANTPFVRIKNQERTYTINTNNIVRVIEYNFKPEYVLMIQTIGEGITLKYTEEEHGEKAKIMWKNAYEKLTGLKLED